MTWEWIKDLSAGDKTAKLLEETIGGNLRGLGLRNKILSDATKSIEATKEENRFKNFHASKHTLDCKNIVHRREENICKLPI